MGRIFMAVVVVKKIAVVEATLERVAVVERRLSGGVVASCNYARSNKCENMFIE